MVNHILPNKLISSILTTQDLRGPADELSFESGAGVNSLPPISAPNAIEDDKPKFLKILSLTAEGNPSSKPEIVAENDSRFNISDILKKPEVTDWWKKISIISGIKTKPTEFFKTLFTKFSGINVIKPGFIRIKDIRSFIRALHSGTKQGKWIILNLNKIDSFPDNRIIILPLNEFTELQRLAKAEKSKIELPIIFVDNKKNPDNFARISNHSEKNEQKGSISKPGKYSIPHNLFNKEISVHSLKQNKSTGQRNTSEIGPATGQKQYIDVTEAGEIPVNFSDKLPTQTDSNISSGNFNLLSDSQFIADNVALYGNYGQIKGERAAIPDLSEIEIMNKSGENEILQFGNSSDGKISIESENLIKSLQQKTLLHPEKTHSTEWTKTFKTGLDNPKPGFNRENHSVTTPYPDKNQFSGTVKSSLFTLASDIDSANTGILFSPADSIPQINKLDQSDKIQIRSKSIVQKSRERTEPGKLFGHLKSIKHFSGESKTKAPLDVNSFVSAKTINRTTGGQKIDLITFTPIHRDDLYSDENRVIDGGRSPFHNFHKMNSEAIFRNSKPVHQNNMGQDAKVKTEHSVIENLNPSGTHSGKINMQGNRLENPHLQTISLRELPEKLSEDIHSMIQDKTRFARINLSPKSLGPVQISLKFDENEVTARILVQSHDVQQSIQKHIHKISQIVEGAHLKLKQMDVILVNSGQNTGNHSDSQQHDSTFHYSRDDTNYFGKNDTNKDDSYSSWYTDIEDHNNQDDNEREISFSSLFQA